MDTLESLDAEDVGGAISQFVIDPIEFEALNEFSNLLVHVLRIILITFCCDIAC